MDRMNRAFDNGWLTNDGPLVRELETRLAELLGVKHCVAVNTGTSALHLALVAAGVGPGDEVVTVPMTFIATSWAVSYCGARPVYVDVDPATYTMDPNQVADRITSSCLELFCGYGYSKEYPAEKYYRDAKIGRIYEGTTNIQKLTIAKQILA